jgi:nicotinamidase/pyrazinamidase
MSTFQNGYGLLIVDVQKDFCPVGARAVEQGDRIIPNLNHWIQEAQRLGLPVYASRDWHPQGHISFKEQAGLWPPHCIQDSDGAEFHPDLHLPENVVKIARGIASIGIRIRFLTEPVWPHN